MIVMTEGREEESERVLQEMVGVQRYLLEELGLRGQLLELATEDMGGLYYSFFTFCFYFFCFFVFVFCFLFCFLFEISHLFSSPFSSCLSQIRYGIMDAFSFFLW